MDEISGDGNHNTAEYWEYDTRLGRRWNVDPVLKSYESPYACFSNNPIIYVDIHGNDKELPEVTVEAEGYTGKPEPIQEGANRPEQDLKGPGIQDIPGVQTAMPAGSKIKAYMDGVVNAMQSDVQFGLFSKTPEEYSTDPEKQFFYAKGRLLGDALATVLGGTEGTMGAEGAAYTTATLGLELETVVGTVGIPETALIGYLSSGVMIVNGALIVNTARADIIETQAWLRSHEMHGGNNGNSSSAGGKKPTPDTNPQDFKKLKGDQGYIYKKTGEIYKKSHTSHGNKGNTGKQWKVFPKGTKNFGKQTGVRTTVDGEGNIIGD